MTPRHRPVFDRVTIPVLLTDPDARSLVSQAKGTGVVGYNAQAVVDAKHHLNVTHAVLPHLSFPCCLTHGQCERSVITHNNKAAAG